MIFDERGLHEFSVLIKNYVDTSIVSLKALLVKDTTPIDNSSNFITSGGVKDYVDKRTSGAYYEPGNKLLVNVSPKQETDSITLQKEIQQEVINREAAIDEVKASATGGNGVISMGDTEDTLYINTNG